MPNAHNAALVGEAIIHIGIDLLEVANLLQHFDDTFIGTAMQGALKRADGASDCAIHIAQGGDGDTAAEGGGIEPVVGMEDVADVHGAFHVFTGFIAGDEPNEISGFAETVVRLQNLLALAQAMEGGDDHWDLRDDLDGFLPNRFKVILCLGFGIEAAQSTDAGAEGMHRGGVFR